MEISIILGLICSVSILANVLILRLAIWQSKELADISDGLGDLVEIIESYRNHLRDVYQLDSFYGDETLEGLMTHTNAVRALLEEQYGNVINITNPIEYQIEEVEENGEEESTEKEKHVFYAGSRRRDN
mgnify:CR=1 FL=1|tara:strand:- start:93 stop:479 length:387 start_codon:yes stop_codon:yes gene_type:complete